MTCIETRNMKKGNILDSALRFSLVLLLVTSGILTFGYSQLQGKNIETDQKLESKMKEVGGKQAELMAVTSELADYLSQ